MHLDQNVSLKTLHTFGMDVEAKYFVEAKTPEEILTLLNYRKMIRMPILFLGGGSNILFTRDFPGIVIRINVKGIEVMKEDQDGVWIRVQAGEIWDTFVQFCVDKGWPGVENLSLIPGTVGGAPVQNIGAYGVEVKEVIDAIHYVEIDSGKQHHIDGKDCCFGYRDSIFKQTLRGKVILMDVTFKLNKKAAFKLDYGNIRNELTLMQVETPTLNDVRTAVSNIRLRKLPDPAKIGNAGSFFKNPMIFVELWESLKMKFPSIPGFKMDSGRIKIPAAWLLEQCGWKGYRIGDAGVYPDQPLVLVNYGNASGIQILDLANKMIESVQEEFGIHLEMEVNVI
ncbi:MAG: UDP-N-acetylmuramate dehydrogenase [Bacteroidales bacterium]|nr:UDP-N-acetylmuramate dehydrogenase [Bacteroidales bacterium]